MPQLVYSLLSSQPALAPRCPTHTAMPVLLSAVHYTLNSACQLAAEACCNTPNALQCCFDTLACHFALC